MNKFTRFFFRTRNFLNKKVLSDEYLTWLQYANAGMLDPGNAYSLDHAINKLANNSAVIEIGSFCGLSTNTIAYLLKKHGKLSPFYTCDNWDVSGVNKSGRIGNSDITYEKYGEYVKKTFINNTTFFSAQKPYTVDMDADSFMKKWGNNETVEDVFGRSVSLGGLIGLAYVDGIHSYENVKREFVSIDKFLIIGGHILFDDTSDQDPFGLSRLMKEIKNNKKYELVLKNPNYLFKKISS